MSDDAPLIDPNRLDEMGAIIGAEARDAMMRRMIDELDEQPTRMNALAATGDWAAARQTAHYLRGAALSIGAMRVAGLAKQIELASDEQMPADVATLAASAVGTRHALSFLLD